MAESLVKRHSIAINKDGVGYTVQGENGNTYTYFAVGTSLLMVPLYVIGSIMAKFVPAFPDNLILEFSVSLLNQFITALICTVLYGICRLIGYSLKTSIITVLIYGLGTIAWPYAKTSWSEPQATLFLLTALFFVLLYRRDVALKAGSSASLPRYVPYVWIGLSGLCAVLAFIVRFEAVIYAPAILAFLIWHLTKREERFQWRQLMYCVLSFSVPVILFMSVNLFYNFSRFGSLFQYGYKLVVEDAPSISGEYISSRLSWLFPGVFIDIYRDLFSTGKSIFLYSPPVILFFWSIKPFYKQHKTELILLCTILAPLSAFLAFTGAHSSWAWGERYSILAVPFLIIPLGAIIQNFTEGENNKVAQRRRAFKIAFVIVCIFGFLVQVIAISTSFQVVFEELLEQEGALDWHKIQYFPHYSPLLLHYKEFISYFPSTYQMLKKGPGNLDFLSHYTSESQSKNPEYQKLATTDVIRKNTFDFWFLYCYFAGIPLILILIPLTLFIIVFVLSVRRIFRVIKIVV